MFFNMEVLCSDFEVVQTNVIAVNTEILVWFVEDCICALSLLEIFLWYPWNENNVFLLIFLQSI